MLSDGETKRVAVLSQSKQLMQETRATLSGLGCLGFRSLMLQAPLRSLHS